MCELYNTFLKSYNTGANITAQLYSGKERSWERGKVKKIKKDKQMSLIK